jgi:hypothetical protein
MGQKSSDCYFSKEGECGNKDTTHTHTHTHTHKCAHTHTHQKDGHVKIEIYVQTKHNDCGKPP